MLSFWTSILKLLHLAGNVWAWFCGSETPLSPRSPCRDSSLGSLRNTQEYINNESFQTSTAITCRNLYITTKSLVPLHKGICYCHTVQLASACNCCISMRFCTTTRILLWVFEQDPCTILHKEIKTYIHTISCILFFARRATRVCAHKCVFRYFQSERLGAPVTVVHGGKR